MVNETHSCNYFYLALFCGILGRMPLLFLLFNKHKVTYEHMKEFLSFESWLLVNVHLAWHNGIRNDNIISINFSFC